MCRQPNFKGGVLVGFEVVEIGFWVVLEEVLEGLLGHFVQMDLSCGNVQKPSNGCLWRQIEDGGDISFDLHPSFLIHIGPNLMPFAALNKGWDFVGLAQNLIIDDYL